MQRVFDWYEEYLNEDEIEEIIQDEAFYEDDAWQCNEDYHGNVLFGWQEHRLQEIQIELAQEDEENLIYQTMEYL
ncbi:MAG: hypothetical protein IKF17_03250 [Clostridia bacterium]|nr:hypothetical protein [Clostridia bacterium]